MPMITCSECGKHNTLDGTYCRGCGNQLAASAIAEARLANEQLAAEGFKLLGDSRYEEAMMVAQSVLDADPVSVQGHALRGDALERRGDLPGAISAYERVLELQPDATLEKIKLTHAKNVLAERAALAPKPNKRMALLAGLSAIIFVACVGALAAIMVNPGLMQPKPTQVAQVDPVASKFTTPQAEETKALASGNVDQPKRPSADNASQIDSAASENRQPSRDEATNASRPNPSRLPDARTNTGRPSGLEGELRPARPELTAQPINPAPNGGTSSAARPTDPDPQPVNGGNAGGPGSAETAPSSGSKPPRPVIDVKPSDSNSGRTGGSESRPSNGGSISVKVKSARDAMLAGNNAEAAQLFEAALAAGADPGINNQHLATCYERIGRKTEAIRCYEQAAATYERRIAGGDDSARTKSAAEACRQAAKALRG